LQSNEHIILYKQFTSIVSQFNDLLVFNRVPSSYINSSSFCFCHHPGDLVLGDWEQHQPISREESGMQRGYY
jgi:hypothetical protein